MALGESECMRGRSETSVLPDRDPKDECRVEATIWTGGQKGTEVWLYRVEGGGHTWPGGIQYLPRALIGRVTHDINSHAIWDFFRTHPKLRYQTACETARRTRKCTRVADRAFPQIKVSWRQPGDFGRSPSQEITTLL